MVVRTNARVAEVMADGVRLADGSVIPSELVVWSAGVKAPDFLADIGGLETNRINQLVVNATLQTTRDDEHLRDRRLRGLPDARAATGRVPPRAQAAHQQASFMVKQIRAVMAQRPLERLSLSAISDHWCRLGKYSTVGSLMGFVVGKSMFIEGQFARLMYRSLYKMHEAALHGGGRTLLSLVTPGARPAPTVKAALTCRSIVFTTWR